MSNREFDVQEIAILSGVSRITIMKWIREKKLPVHREQQGRGRGKCQWLCDAKDLAEFLVNREQRKEEQWH